MEEVAYLLALSRLKGVGTLTLRKLFEATPHIEDLFEKESYCKAFYPSLYEAHRDFFNTKKGVEEAQKDIDEARAKGISVFSISDELYPNLLRECIDAPLFFFYKGNVEALQSQHKLTVVGTRNVSPYGRKMVDHIIGDLAKMLPDLVIVSGLAYGVDILAHQAALKYNLSTIGVLAHGLDRIYPYSHRKDAVAMLQKGGLLSEYPLGTSVEKHQFVARNRIVAALSPLTFVVESAVKGGSLLTASMAIDYYRDVCALPGRATDTVSEGCNILIQKQQAAAVTSAQDILDLLGWESQVNKTVLQEPKEVEERSCAPQDPIVKILKEEESIHFNELLQRLDIAAGDLSAQLLDLEMKGIITALAGGKYTIV